MARQKAAEEGSNIARLATAPAVLLRLPPLLLPPLTSVLLPALPPPLPLLLPSLLLLPPSLLPSPLLPPLLLLPSLLLLAPPPEARAATSPAVSSSMPVAVSPSATW